MVRHVIWVPVVCLLVRSLAGRWLWPDVLPTEWSGRGWEAVRMVPVANSFGLATVAMLGAVLLSLALARPFRRLAWVRWAVLTVALLPPLAMGVGLHGLFLRLGLTDSWAGVALVHLLPATPYAVMAVAASWSRFDEDLAAQARTLGASRWQVWRYVKGPALLPGIATGAAFAFVISWSQYVLTALIGGGRVLTLPMALVGYQQSGDEAVAAAVGLLYLGVPVALSTAMGWRRYD